MAVRLTERIESACKFDHLFRLAVVIHVALLTLSAFPVLLGELEPGGTVVLTISVAINLALLSLALGVLLSCRDRFGSDGF